MITENTTEGINSRITEAKEQISELKDRIVEITAMEQNKEKRMKRNEDSLRDIGHNIKSINIRINARRRRERERARENIEEIIVKKFPNMGKERVIQDQEGKRVPYRIKPRRNMTRNILIKLTETKYKEKILKAAREKQKITT